MHGFSGGKRVRQNFMLVKEPFRSASDISDNKERWESFEEITRFLENPRFPKIKKFQRKYVCIICPMSLKNATFHNFSANSWEDDEEFARQLVGGCSPNRLKKCRSLPANLPVSDDMVKNSLDAGKDLKVEIAAGKVFIADCAIASGVQQEKPCVPICLLYQSADGKLKPIAIQLQQAGGQGNPIFTPSSATYDWMLAKMYFRSAESNIQQVIGPFTITNLLLVHM